MQSSIDASTDGVWIVANMHGKTCRVRLDAMHFSKQISTRRWDYTIGEETVRPCNSSRSGSKANAWSNFMTNRVLYWPQKKGYHISAGQIIVGGSSIVWL